MLEEIKNYINYPDRVVSQSKDAIEVEFCYVNPLNDLCSVGLRIENDRVYSVTQSGSVGGNKTKQILEAFGRCLDLINKFDLKHWGEHFN
jgi:hypothetical protein